MVAQGAHASIAAVLEHVNKKMADDRYLLPGPMVTWLEGSFTKVTLSCDSEQELLDLYQKALDAGTSCALIQDAGKTEFNGVPTYTAVAIGPDYPEVIDPITGDLKLL